MLYNKKTKDINKNKNCLTCEYFINNKCEGIGKVCFVYDPKTNLCIDPILKKPFKVKGE